MDFTDFMWMATRTSKRDGVLPFPYQSALALQPWPDVLTVPTGLGKTAAVVLAWAWKRGWRPDGRRVTADPHTPRRLVYCLPMRVLVEQTQRECERWLHNLGALGRTGEGRVGVHLLMGGSESLATPVWAEHPEEDQILIGTQDMLLSRALMRGYGMSRYQWPVHFAMLHNDAMWVFDEVQLMGPGLVTGVQIEAFRRSLQVTRRSRSLWMSATLDPEWMRTVDFDPASLQFLSLSAEEQSLPAVKQRRNSVKPLSRSRVACLDDGKPAIGAYLAALAAEVVSTHRPGGTTLLILNTVERAQGLLREIEKLLEPAVSGKKKGGAAALAAVPERLLVHSRFRARERAEQNVKLAAPADPNGPGRILVATQAIEAGVDLSARVLYTELAPYASLVQRFGRCNRYGEFNESADAQVFWLDLVDPKPYRGEELEAARAQLDRLESAAPADLPPVEAEAPLYPVLRRKDFLELFSTEADLSGFDIDISPYIRGTDDADVMLFWRQWSDAEEASAQAPASRDELCRAGLVAARRLLDRKDVGRGDVQVWDTLARGWTQPWPRDIRLRPGMTLMLRSTRGGYSARLGLATESSEPVEVVDMPGDRYGGVEAIDDDHRSLLAVAVPLPVHLCNVGQEAQLLCAALDVPEADEVVRAARWHDVGKAHEAFQSMLRTAQTRANAGELGPGLWAKSGGGGRGPSLYRVAGESAPRRHFRHELASMLAWLALHDDEPGADLIAYLIAAHHGKVRLSLRALPGETEAPPGRLFARGVWHGDRLPAVPQCGDETVPGVELRLNLMQLGESEQGASWTTRTQRLLAAFGPFRLAWLESIVRIADWRASRNEQREPQEVEPHG